MSKSKIVIVKQSTQVVKGQKVCGMIPDWITVPVGTRFQGYIEENPVEGRIQKEDGRIFLCQNIKDGAEVENTLGHKHSWSIGDGSEDRMMRNDVVITYLFLDPDFKAPVAWEDKYVAGYKPVFLEGSVKFGCQEVSNDVIRKVASMLIDKPKPKYNQGFEVREYPERPLVLVEGYDRRTYVRYLAEVTETSFICVSDGSDRFSDYLTPWEGKCELAS